MVRRINELESLRGLMALWVMFGHVYLTFPGAQTDLIGRVLRNNGYAVDVFIILSGFVIFNLLDREGGGFWPYLIRRAFRIYPVYLVLLAASVALMGLYAEVLSDPFWSSPRNDARLRILAEGEANLGAHLLAHLTLAHGLIPSRWLPSSEYTLLGQAWSISLEWQFYIVAPLCFWAVTRAGPRGTLAVLAVTFAAHLALRGFAGEGFLPAAAPYFVLGCASYFLWKHQADVVHALGTSLIAVTAAIVALAAMLSPLPVAIWAAVLGTLLIHHADPGFMPTAVIARLLQNRVLLWIGSISYSLYLVHMIPLVLALHVMPASFRHSGLYQPYLYVTVTAASLALSWLIFRLFEERMTRQGKVVAAKLSRSGPTTSTAS